MILPDMKTQNEILQYMVHTLLKDTSPEYQTTYMNDCSILVISEKFKRTQFPRMNIEIKYQ